MGKLYKVLKRMKTGTEDLNYGRNIVVNYACHKAFSEKSGILNILDLGAGEGTDLLNIRKVLQKKAPGIRMNLYAVENYQPNIDHLEKLGINTFPVDIEKDRLPFEREEIDMIVMNQVLEHTKEIFWIFAEMHRILKPGGQVILGIPNLASLHNRIALLSGGQPTCIKVLGPHVRGFCFDGLAAFVEEGGFYHVERLKGSNFYPFPGEISRKLSKYFPTLSVSIFLDIRKTGKPGNYIEVLDTHFWETSYKRYK